MSKQELYKLAQAAQTHLLQKTKDLRPALNKQPHVFLVSSDIVRNEILAQIKRKKVTKLQSEAIDIAVTAYVDGLYKTIQNTRSDKFNFVISGQPPRFQVLVTSFDNNSDVFVAVQKIRSQKRDLQMLGGRIADIFSRDDTVTRESLRNLFDVGHVKGQSVSEKMMQEALAKFSTINNTQVRTQFPELATIINIAVKSYETVDLDKVFSVTVTDESYSVNRSKGAKEETQELKAARKAVNEFIEKNVDWPSQGGSRNKIEIIVSELLGVSKKRKAKVKGKITKKSTPAKVSTTIKGRVNPAKVITGTSIGKLNVPPQKEERDQVTKSKDKWLSIVNIINAKLADRIKSNMIAPKLVNRTGRFAESAKVTEVVPTAQGFPSFVFDYQRNPYEVFDRVNGRSPWNTPNRDPKSLIALSIREIAQELAIGRFYTRRA